MSEVKNLKACYIDFKGITDTSCVTTAWPNGEGYDIHWYGGGEEKHISLHAEEIESMIACLKHMKFFDE